MKKNKQLKIEELLACQLENIDTFQNVLKVMKVQKNLLSKLIKKQAKRALG